jgi:acyl-CoA synthetase (AMP-forming)/AMP-acid ligase II
VPAPTVREVDSGLLERHKVRLVEPGAGTALVGHGPTAGFDVRIVDPDTREVLPHGEIGEIWAAGPSVAAGYWKRPRATAEEFEATTADGDGPFLRTGDLGFMLDGELFVTGRLKDLIIVQGRNIYPQDLEFAIRDLHPVTATRPGAAFSVDGGREHIVVVQEVRMSRLGGLEPAELAADMRQALVSGFDVPYPSIVLIDRPVPRTTSGKVQRRATKALFLAGDLAPVHEDLEPALAAFLAGRG